MIKKLKSLNTRFFITALSLITITSILGLSAYITEKSEYSGHFRVASGTDLGFRITGNPIDPDVPVSPGDTIEINASASVEKSIPLYVFVEFDLPASCEKYYFYDADWHPIDEDSNIYYYGFNGSVSPLGGENTASSIILNGLTLNQSAREGESFDFSITGYAIQTEHLGIPATNPAGIFELIKEQNATDDASGG